MVASKIALASLFLAATDIAGGNKFALGLDVASQYRIARGSHDERGNKFALGLDDASQYRITRGSHVEPASDNAGVDAVGKQKSLRGSNGVGTSPNESTKIDSIDADGTVPAAKIGRSIHVGALVRVSQLPE